jgi:hypothetical protein
LEISASVDFQPPPFEWRHATSTSAESNLQKPDKCWIRGQSAVNLNRYGLRVRAARERVSKLVEAW